MTLADAGDLFLIGLSPTPTLGSHDRALLSELRPAGVILYKSNFRHDLPYEGWLSALSTLLAEVRTAIGRDQIFIGIDHEGGRVCRTPPPLTRFDYPRRYARQAEAVGRSMGRELASIGVNLDFAPLLDIHSNPKNPVIGERAFGSTADEVIEAAVAFEQGLAAQGVLACGKHFPGHGDTHEDSHVSLPTVEGDLDALHARELRPFAAARHFPMIMTSHVLFPAIDPAVPATLSKRIVHGLLREELGYQGVVVSDDVGMGAVSRMFEDPRNAVRVIDSGSDLLMVCAHFASTDRARGFATAILEARADGSLDRATFEAARSRVHALRERSTQHTPTLLTEAQLGDHRASGPLFAASTVEVT